MLKVYRFTGDIKKLKTLGYTFQKLYARNYKCYHLKPIWLFVKGGCVVEIDNLQLEHQEKVISFILRNLHRDETFWYVESGMFADTKFARWSLIDGVLYNKKSKRIKAKYDIDFIFRDGFKLSLEFIENIRKLNELGTFELIEII